MGITLYQASSSDAPRPPDDSAADRQRGRRQGRCEPSRLTTSRCPEGQSRHETVTSSSSHTTVDQSKPGNWSADRAVQRPYVGWTVISKVSPSRQLDRQADGPSPAKVTIACSLSNSPYACL